MGSDVKYNNVVIEITPISHSKTLLVAIVVTTLIFAVPVHGEIPVNATDVGYTYILWNWTTAEETVDIFIDGDQMCGYETTEKWYLLTGLNQGEMHTIRVVTASDSGTNTTWTNLYVSNGSASASSPQPEDALPALPMVIGGIVAAAIVLVLLGRTDFGKTQ